MLISRADVLQADLQEWLRAYLTEELEVPAGSIDPAEPMSDYGLDSVRAITILTDVEKHVGFDIDPNALWEYPTIASFTDVLASRLATMDRQRQSDGPESPKQPA